MGHTEQRLSIWKFPMLAVSCRHERPVEHSAGAEEGTGSGDTGEQDDEGAGSDPAGSAL